MPVKILQFVPEALPTFRADVAVLFGKYMPRHEVVCDIVGMASPEPAALQGFASARRPPYRAGRLRRELDYLWLCARVLLGTRKSDCDAIQVRDMVPIGLLALLVARCKGVPFYYWVSYLMSEGRIERAEEKLRRSAGLRERLVLWKGKVERQLLYRWMLPAADHVFVQSDAMLEVMRAKGLDAARMTVVPMGVDMERLEAPAVAARPPGWEGVPLIAYLGTLDGARNLERVVDVLALVRQHTVDACLLLIGSAPTPGDEFKLRDYIAGQGLTGAVRITGWLPSSEAWQLLAGAEVAISYIPRGALYDVSSPTKLLEYLALGMPAVGNDTPDQAHVLTQSQAGWLTASTPEAMAAAVADILGHPERARQRAAGGGAYIERTRSYRVLGAMVADKYRSLLRP